MVRKVKKKVKTLVLCLTVTIMFLISFNASSQFQKPTLKEGDYWFYEFHVLPVENINYSYYGNINVTVKGKTTVNVEGTAYHTITLVENHTVTLIQNGNTGTRNYILTKYLDEKGLSLIMYTKNVTNTGEYFTNYINPPLAYPWPIETGKKWDINYTRKIVEKNGNITLTNYTYKYNCTGTKTITTDAGTFNCYVVEITSPARGYKNRSVRYYSPDVGYQYVKEEEYANGEIWFEINLLSFGHIKTNDETNNNTGENSQKNNTPGFEAYTLITAATSVYIVTTLFKKKQK